MKIVITGAPHSGKTTLIEELKRQGHTVVPESAIDVINSLEELMPNRALNWRRQYFEAFQALISMRQQSMEENASIADNGRKIFYDRGAYDGLAFAMHYGSDVPESIYNVIKQSSYDKIFLLDLVTPFDPRSNTGRVETEKDCKDIQLLLELVYRRQGYDPIRVPLLPTIKRIEFILKECNL